MEGVGSRLGRTSSRYSQTPTVFNGPVRRWKKKWVHVSSSSSSVTYQSNGYNNNNNDSSRLLLCRWTPISPATAEPEKGSGAAPEEPPRRKFRYTPVSVLEEQKKAAEKKFGDVEKTGVADQSVHASVKMHGNSITDHVMQEQAEELDNEVIQDSNRSHLDLDMGLNGHSANLDSNSQINEARMKKASTGKFWLG